MREDRSGSGITVASVLVQARAEAHERLEAAISALPGTSVHARGAGGKLVVVVETTSDAELVGRIDEIGGLPGVLGVNLVYHHSEAAGAVTDLGPESQ